MWGFGVEVEETETLEIGDLGMGKCRFGEGFGVELKRVIGLKREFLP